MLKSNLSMSNMKYPIVIRPGQDGWFVVDVPDLPGCVTQGRTIKEAEENAKEAIECHIASLKDLGKTVPLPKTLEEVIEVEP